jgi:GMP reductase
MTEELILSGADIVKIGIGPGAGCLTRQKTGVGYPQLSAIIECADAAHGLKGHIIADGGCRNPGDIAKAFGAGADFVMLGSILACHDENSDFDEFGFAEFYGMSSSRAMNKYYGEVAKHRTSEGRIVKMGSKGSLHDTIQDILGGLRSACTYVGAEKLKELSKRTTFVRVNNQLNTTYEKRTVGE